MNATSNIRPAPRIRQETPKNQRGAEEMREAAARRNAELEAARVSTLSTAPVKTGKYPELDAARARTRDLVLQRRLTNLLYGRKKGG